MVKDLGLRIPRGLNPSTLNKKRGRFSAPSRSGGRKGGEPSVSRIPALPRCQTRGRPVVGEPWAVAACEELERRTWQRCACG
ncbi:hypothetical protein V6Z11_D10G046700 [Gossypium hirsutum]